MLGYEPACLGSGKMAGMYRLIFMIECELPVKQITNYIINDIGNAGPVHYLADDAPADCAAHHAARASYE